MSEYENILYENDNGIAIVTINRPKSLNALNTATMEKLSLLLDQMTKDKEVKVVIITGSGDKAFIAGADITEMRFMTAMEARDFGRFGQLTLSKIEKLHKPVIAAVNGFALGGGCELALACDIRIASEQAQFGLPEVSLGITPGFGGTQRLARLVGKGVAKELIFTGEIINAAKAQRIGLINKVESAEGLMDAAKNMAKKIMTKAPAAVQMAKIAVNKGINLDLDSGISYEAEVFGLCFATNDQKEGMAAFLEKRPAVFCGK